MCLLLVARDVRQDCPLVVAANRDEFHERPTAPAAWWGEPEVLAGRDLEAGGTWLGVSRAGRFAAVTNYREPSTGEPSDHSRGELPLRALSAQDDRALLATLDAEADRYRGYNLLFGTPSALHYQSNRGSSITPLPAGVHGISNGLLGDRWPKVRRGTAALAEAMERQPEVDALLDILHDTVRPPDADLPDTGVGAEWERLLAPMFIIGRRYGTRCSTVVVMHADGRIEFAERRYDRAGEAAGETREQFVRAVDARPAP